MMLHLHELNVNARAAKSDRRSASATGQPHHWLVNLLGQRSVQVTLTAWVVANILIQVIAQGSLPFDRPSMADMSFGQQILIANAMIVEIVLLMVIAYALTRRRAVPAMVTRAPAAALARSETLLLVAYGVLAQLAGLLLGRSLGWDAISFHLVGTMYGTHKAVAPIEVFVWAGYNFLVYAVLPFLFFRRRYSAEDLNLRSSDRRNDLRLIVVILLLETLFELVAGGFAIFELSPRQVALGAPLTFGVYFLGTVMPTMVFIYCILLPRYLRLTGSAATTVILGGLTYALLHFFDAWMVFKTPGDAALSLIFLLMLYVAPGMFKSLLTLRTGNAWVHVWAYHAIVPHTIGNTGLIVKIFGIR
ncbi:MAG TPA: hypothetical protein VFK26_00715 [Gemmatimonadaceae bacterium]|nr:hypothetical protein [Gemmatimonadaceae bacterium]